MVSSTGWWWTTQKPWWYPAEHYSSQSTEWQSFKSKGSLITQTSSQTHTDVLYRLSFRVLTLSLINTNKPLEQSCIAATIHMQWQFSEELLLSTCTCDGGGGLLCMWKCGTCVHDPPPWAGKSIPEYYLSCRSIKFALNQQWISLKNKTINERKKEKKYKHQYF